MGFDCLLSTAPVQMKELTFSFGIGANDLAVKLKRVEGWVEKKHHVRLTLRSGSKLLTENLVRKNTHISDVFPPFFFFAFYLIATVER